MRIDGVEHAVGEEVRHVRHDGFAALAFYQVDEVFVGVRVVFDEDFADYADARAFDAVDGDGGEFAHHLADVALVCAPASVADVFARGFAPFLVERVCRAFFLFVGARAEQQAHEDVAVVYRHERAPVCAERHFELFGVAALLLVCGEDTHLREASGVERAAQQVDVVAGAAGSAGLGVEAVGFVGVVLSALERL